jgi:hypothetical protein
MFAAPLLWLAAPLLVYIVPMVVVGLAVSALVNKIQATH